MKGINIKTEDSAYQFDLNRICRVMAANGFRCSNEEAKVLWRTYSESMAAGWMSLPDSDEDLFGILSMYFTETEE